MRWRTRRAVLALGRPDRPQDRHDVGSVDGVDAPGGEARHGVLAQARPPLALVPAAPPALGVDGDDGLARLGEGRHAPGAAPGVAPVGDGAGVVERLLAGRGEGHDGVGSEADAGGSAVGPDGLGPRLGDAAVGGGLDEEAQAVAAVAVPVPAGQVDGTDEGGGEPPGSFSVAGLHVRVLASLRGLCCDAAYRRDTGRSNYRMFISVLNGLCESSRHTEKTPETPPPRRAHGPEKSGYGGQTP